MLVSHAKNVGKSNNNMKPIFLSFQWIYKKKLLVQPAVLLIIAGMSQNKLGYSFKKYFLLFPLIYLISFRPNLNNGPDQCMAYLK